MDQAGNENAVPAEIKKSLQGRGFRVSTIAGLHAAELCAEVGQRAALAELDAGLTQRYLGGFIKGQPVAIHPQGTIFVIAYPSPISRLTFTVNGMPRTVIAPPTYIGYKRKRAEAVDLLNQALVPAGYRATPVFLPNKLSAVRSGLGAYGRNNVVYVQELGSFAGLATFYADFPIVEDAWQPARMVERCESCKVCRKTCPTQAISSERFLIHAEKCLTYHNESDHPFAGWLNAGWHNCLVGCLKCQLSCPENRRVKNWVVDEASFSTEETDMILENGSEELPAGLANKLEELDLLEYREVLGRNLRVLL